MAAAAWGRRDGRELILPPGVWEHVFSFFRSASDLLGEPQAERNHQETAPQTQEMPTPATQQIRQHQQTTHVAKNADVVSTDTVDAKEKHDSDTTAASESGNTSGSSHKSNFERVLGMPPTCYTLDCLLLYCSGIRWV